MAGRWVARAVSVSCRPPTLTPSTCFAALVFVRRTWPRRLGGPRPRVREVALARRPRLRGDRGAPLHGRDAAERGQRPSVDRCRRRRRRRGAGHRPPRQDQQEDETLDVRFVKDAVAGAIRTLRAALSLVPEDPRCAALAEDGGLRFSAAARAGGVEHVTCPTPGTRSGSPRQVGRGVRRADRAADRDVRNQLLEIGMHVVIAPGEIDCLRRMAPWCEAPKAGRILEVLGEEAADREVARSGEAPGSTTRRPSTTAQGGPPPFSAERRRDHAEIVGVAP